MALPLVAIILALSASGTVVIAVSSATEKLLPYMTAHVEFE
jgi:hypothetical protein